jgi:hypothetical protein
MYINNARHTRGDGGDQERQDAIDIFVDSGSRSPYAQRVSTRRAWLVFINLSHNLDFDLSTDISTEILDKTSYKTARLEASGQEKAFGSCVWSVDYRSDAVVARHNEGSPPAVAASDQELRTRHDAKSLWMMDQSRWGWRC